VITDNQAPAAGKPDELAYLTRLEAATAGSSGHSAVRHHGHADVSCYPTDDADIEVFLAAEQQRNG
jgi:hypothetical protein